MGALPRAAPQRPRGAGVLRGGAQRSPCAGDGGRAKCQLPHVCVRHVVTTPPAQKDELWKGGRVQKRGADGTLARARPRARARQPATHYSQLGAGPGGALQDVARSDVKKTRKPEQGQVRVQGAPERAARRRPPPVVSRDTEKGV